MEVAITVDLEHDCPPFLTTYRGVTQGMPLLLDLLAAERVPATFFCTGDVARKHPAIVQRLVGEGHELGCHGDTHARFGAMDRDTAARELRDAGTTLRAFGCEVTSFRAPNLDFPSAFLPLLTSHGFRLDSSQGRHKPGSFFTTPALVAGVERVPATIAPSAVRLPRPIRNALFSRMRDPVVFFFHPWEFVDVTREPIPLDCRFKTGEPALASLRETIAWFRQRGATFRRMRELSHHASRRAA
ncbi:MAG TPA: polysaccharide deacetylase family protein [Polyangia bacterium]|nr:polysaccharide deacetylase family protein [Polyangia bacterium]